MDFGDLAPALARALLSEGADGTRLAGRDLEEVRGRLRGDHPAVVDAMAGTR